MKKAFFEDSAMAMAKLIVESIYHGMEENEGVYADLMYSNGKGQHGRISCGFDGLWKLEVCCGI